MVGAHCRQGMKLALAVAGVATTVVIMSPCSLGLAAWRNAALGS